MADDAGEASVSLQLVRESGEGPETGSKATEAPCAGFGLDRTRPHNMLSTRYDGVRALPVGGSTSEDRHDPWGGDAKGTRPATSICWATRSWFARHGWGLPAAVGGEPAADVGLRHQRVRATTSSGDCAPRCVGTGRRSSIVFSMDRPSVLKNRQTSGPPLSSLRGCRRRPFLRCDLSLRVAYRGRTKLWLGRRIATGGYSSAASQEDPRSRRLDDVDGPVGEWSQ